MAKQKDNKFVDKSDKVEVQPDMSPGEYFKILKGKKQKVTDEILSNVYDNCAVLMEKYNRTKQVDAMKKLLFHLETIEKERAVLARGIDTFVYLEDVQKFVEGVQGRVVKIIELERYEREVPDEVVAAYEKVKDLFTKFVVVFTDYTKDHETKAKKERDPILFGMFQDKGVEVTGQRLYFIGDWEDEYCDLTLDRLVVEMKKSSPKDGVEFKVRDPIDLDAVREKIKALDAEQNKGRVNNTAIYIANGYDNTKEKRSAFSRVKTFLGLK